MKGSSRNAGTTDAATRDPQPALPRSHGFYVWWGQVLVGIAACFAVYALGAFICGLLGWERHSLAWAAGYATYPLLRRIGVLS